MARVDNILTDIKQLTKQLLPTGRAFRMPWQGFFQKLMDGLAASDSRFLDDSFSLLDSLLPDNDNFSTNDADQWETRLGIITSIGASLEDRKAAISRKLAHPSTIKARQHYVYLEGQLRDAGFDVYVHENRFGDEVYPPATSELETHQPEDFFPLEGSELITDGSFLIGAPHWTPSGGTVVIGSGILRYSSAIAGDYAEQILAAPIMANSGMYRIRVYLNASLADVRVLLRDGAFVSQVDEIFAGANSTIIIDVDSTGWTGDVETIRILNRTDPSGDVEYISIVSLLNLEDHDGLEENYYGFEYTNYVVNYIDRNRELFYDFGPHLKSTFFIGGRDLFDIAGGNLYADVDASRINEFRQLILRLKPAQTKAFLFINEV